MENKKKNVQFGVFVKNQNCHFVNMIFKSFQQKKVLKSWFIYFLQFLKFA